MVIFFVLRTLHDELSSYIVNWVGENEIKPLCEILKSNTTLTSVDLICEKRKRKISEDKEMNE